MLTVLVVCTGNICRSPLAHGFLADRTARVLPGRFRTRSAGTWAGEGREPMPESLAVARERGIDLSGLRSSRLAPDAIRDADLVLGMAGEHREEVLSLVPEARPKTFALKELVALLEALPAVRGPLEDEEIRERIAAADALRRGPDAPAIPDEDILDPLGLSIAAYRAVGIEIEAFVDRLVALLLGVA